MTVFQVLMFCYVLLYFILAGQAVFYKLCFTRVFGEIPGSHFIAVRKLADPILAKRLALVYYSSLVLGITLVVMAVINSSLAVITLSALAFLMLVADVVLARKYNIPLNTQIRDLSEPTDAISGQLQYQWLKWIDIRGNFILAGFVVLIILLAFF